MNRPAVLASLVVTLLLGAAPALGQPTTAREIASSAPFRSAVAAMDADYERIVDEIVLLTEIPAPPFKEAKRAKAYMAMLRDAGLSDVEMDAEGNVMGLRRGTGPAGGSLVVIAAHLDTVFPEETDVTVRRDGSRLMAPGIGDDTRGLATLLGYARALDKAGIRTRRDILFVGNVGEEGQGDLRGMRYFFAKGKYRERVETFISMDGSGATNVVNGGVGSKRYRVTFNGPGGHSFGAFGLVNPLGALGQTVVDLYRIQTPAKPKTTYSASVIGGGTSVNSIPNSVFLEVDMRSEDPGELAKLESAFLGIVSASVAAENAARQTTAGSVSADIKLIGDRPAGMTPPATSIVVQAQEAIRAAGLTPNLTYSSTDSNIPMSLGIPAITIGSGGAGGRAHALDEWIDVDKDKSLPGMAVGLNILLAAANG
jgi:tripeptide aminopeptidase